MIAQRDFIYCGIPWKARGRSRETGVDCAGLAALYLRDELGIIVEAPGVSAPMPVSCRSIIHRFCGETLERGDLVFFARSGQVVHVAVNAGGDRWLHILNGHESRIDNGFALMRRLNLTPCGYLRANEADRICAALSDPKVGDAGAVVAIVGLVLSLALSAASYLLTPKLNRQGNRYGRYGFEALVTQNTPEIPLADLLGSVVVAGNSPYTQQSEKGAGGTASAQKANKIIVLGSAPFEEIDYQTGLKINGLGWNDKYFKDTTTLEGIFIDPAQTKAEAVTGSIGSESNVPSVSLYTGAYGVTVPVDVRAEYDREFPIYGLSGCSYLVFRLIDSAKFQNFNVTCRVKGRKCRTFDGAGFTVLTASAESLTGADGSKVRFKLLFEDVVSVASLTVNGTPYAEISTSAQTGNVFHINRTKGYIEFITAPAASATVTITYDYYERVWSQNLAAQMVYLLTEPRRGMGFSASIIDWQAASDFFDHCAETITWPGSNGDVTEPRYIGNYAIDFRKPVTEHLKALSDAANASVFLSGGKLVMRSRKADLPVFSFNESNILAGSFNSELLDRTDRPNRVKLLFHSDESHNAESEVIRDDEANQRARAPRLGNEGVADVNLKMPAVTTPSQAERLAETFLRESVSVRHMAEWTANLQGLPLQPYDVIGLTHSTRPSWADKPFRIETISHDEQDRLVIRAIEHVEHAFI